MLREAPPAAVQLGPCALLAASGQEKMHDSELTYASMHAYLGMAGRGTSKGTAGHGRGRRSCVTRRDHTDVDIT
jgi:hypothetical protein